MKLTAESTVINDGKLNDDISEAKTIANNTAQYFWFTSEGTDTGAHISEIPRSEFEASASGGNLLARSNGIAVREGLTELAVFGADGARVGVADGAHSVMDADGQRFYASDGVTLLANIGYGEGATESGTAASPFYTFGERSTTADVGAYSMAQGVRGNYGYGAYRDVIASGHASHAEGGGTNATGHYSHAEGYLTTASGSGAHAEGSWTTASGSEIESGTERGLGSAHAEGFGSAANGQASHAGGYYTIADGAYQTAIGKYNVAQGTKFSTESTDQCFIVGNGTGASRRSNALTLDWSGNMTIAGTLTQSSDKRLKDHIDYLDKDADEFIRKLKPAHYTKDDAHHVGFYAQDVEEADKWDCMVGELNGFKTLGYTELIAPLVAYCQHLEKRIEELERSKDE